MAPEPRNTLPEPAAEPSSPLPRMHARHLVALIVILLLAAALRVHRLNEKSFWFDEFQSVGMAVGRGFAHFDLPVNVVIPDAPKIIDLATAPPLWKIWYAEPRGH